MSYSSLFAINKRYEGKHLCDYANSWLFSPVVWEVLEDKYFEEDERGIRPSILAIFGKSAWGDMNKIMNSSENTDERICWELSNQNIFYTKDKEVIANSIILFVENHKQYGVKSFDAVEKNYPLKENHIIKRFSQIASDIKKIDEDKFPYFVLKNLSCDDSVEYWFAYDERKRRYKTLKDLSEYTVEFVNIKDSKITSFEDVAKKLNEMKK